MVSILECLGYLYGVLTLYSTLYFIQDISTKERG